MSAINHLEIKETAEITEKHISLRGGSYNYTGTVVPADIGQVYRGITLRNTSSTLTVFFTIHSGKQIAITDTSGVIEVPPDSAVEICDIQFNWVSWISTGTANIYIVIS